MKEVCRLRLDKDPHGYGSKDIEQILQSLAKRKPKWHMQCYPHFKTNLIDCYQANHLNVHQIQN